MDASTLLTVLGTVIQAYAALLGIIGMYVIFLKQKKDDEIRDTENRLKIKMESLINFINREIAPVYPNEILLRDGIDNVDLLIDSISTYESERKKEIPTISYDDVRKLISIWTIVHKEKDELIASKNALINIKTIPVMSRKALLIFISYFSFVVVFGFIGCLSILMGYDQQIYLTMICVIFAIIGMVPLGNLLYRIR